MDADPYGFGELPKAESTHKLPPDMKPHLPARNAGMQRAAVTNGQSAIRAVCGSTKSAL